MDYPSNSNKGKEKKADAEPKKVEKVISGEAVRRKKPLGKRFSETFAGGDAKSVWSYVFLDVIVPAAKDMVVDAASQGVERLIFGEVRGGRRGRTSGASTGFVSYNRFSSGGGRRDDSSRAISRRGRANH